MRQVFDLAIAFEADPKFLAKLMLQSPVDLQLQAVDVNVVADLTDEERVDRK